ncbi:HlyD family secretion protein [Maricurvus nonylphenolicus]|uniref:HlyD family secretion protein n=1 Tax=Maricurvus nonylphenolicus TaxID=1008307 RepID=UPI0036F2A834
MTSMNKALTSPKALGSLRSNMRPYMTRQNKRRAKWIAIVVGLIMLGSMIYERSHTVAISDARIASDVIVISSNRTGWITDFPVSSGQSVEQGQLLVQIDDRAAQLALAEIDVEIASKDAAIARSRNERVMVAEEQASLLASQREKVKSASANARKTESALKLAQSNFDRSSKLREKQLLSKKRWEEDELALQQARENNQQAASNLNQQTAELRKVKAQQLSVQLLEQNIAIMEQQLQALKLKRDQMQLDVADRQVRSPKDAIIDKTFGNVGEYIAPGRRLLMLHDPSDIWINANVKETEVRHIRPGMTAEVIVDAYPDHTFSATVRGIGNATTSEFALLPNPNPSGNFTKVTQRLRITLDIEQVENLLKPGMMVEIKIDTRT